MSFKKDHLSTFTFFNQTLLSKQIKSPTYKRIIKAFTLKSMYLIVMCIRRVFFMKRWGKNKIPFLPSGLLYSDILFRIPFYLIHRFLPLLFGIFPHHPIFQRWLFTFKKKKLWKEEENDQTVIYLETDHCLLGSLFEFGISIKSVLWCLI